MNNTLNTIENTIESKTSTILTDDVRAAIREEMTAVLLANKSLFLEARKEVVEETKSWSIDKTLDISIEWLTEGAKKSFGDWVLEVVRVFVLWVLMNCAFVFSTLVIAAIAFVLFYTLRRYASRISHVVLIASIVALFISCALK